MPPARGREESTDALSTQPGGQPDSEEAVWVRRIEQHSALIWTHAVPPPEILRHYQAVDPTFPDRFFREAETQSAHRMAVEMKVVRANIGLAYLGQGLAFALAFVAIVGGILLLLNNHNVEGLAEMIASLAVLAGVFAYGEYRRRAERMDRSQPGPTEREQ